MNDASDMLTPFKGTARLFPLPNLVLFPQAVQPLHIFEPRYRHMTKDALADDGMIATVLLQPGWEGTYNGEPAVHPIACLGRIVADKKLADGRYVLLVRGVSRVRIVEELKTGNPYRTAHVERIADMLTISPLECRHVRERLTTLLLPRCTGDDKERRQLQEMIDGETALGELCDMLSFRLPMPLEQKQQLLAQPDVGIRAEFLLSVLESLPVSGGSTRPFPPAFSAN